MKKYLYLTIISSILWSCGGGGGDNPPDPTPTNRAPTAPTLVYPTNNLLCIENPVECKWNASTDQEGDAITYQIEVARNSAFTEDKQTFTTASVTQTVPLVEDIAYYWRVKATDSKNASSSYSTTYKFYTYGEGVVNHLPFSPELVKPALNTVVQTTTASLEWAASDVDTNDTLTYDVYFGTSNPPTVMEGNNQAATTLNVTVNASTNYYWYVVVKDGKGGETKGQVWNFKTD